MVFEHTYSIEYRLKSNNETIYNYSFSTNEADAVIPLKNTEISIDGNLYMVDKVMREISTHIKHTTFVVHLSKREI